MFYHLSWALPNLPLEYLLKISSVFYFFETGSPVSEDGLELTIRMTKLLIFLLLLQMVYYNMQLHAQFYAVLGMEAGLHARWPSALPVFMK